MDRSEVSQPEAWYHLDSGPSALHMDLRADLLQRIKDTNPKTIEDLREDRQLGEFMFPHEYHGELGFEGALDVGGTEREGWVRISGRLENYRDDAGILDLEKALPVALSWSIVHQRTSYIPEVEPVEHDPQLVEVTTRYVENRPTIGATVLPAMTRWVAASDGKACEFATEAMREANAIMSGHYREEWTEDPRSCKVECSEDGHIQMQVPEISSVFMTTEMSTFDQLLEEHEMQASNIDGSVQLLTLLVGLSKLEAWATMAYRDSRAPALQD